MNEFLRTIYAGSAAVGITGVLSPIVSALAFVKEEAPDPVLHFWARSILGAAGVQLKVEGLENLPEGHFVLAANHQSHFDALVLFAHIRRHLRFVAKNELKKIPIFGPALVRAGNVFIARSGGEGDKAILAQAVKAVQERVSLVFFAEGTRSDDGDLKPFKKGAAVFAIAAQVPLIPVAIAGTYGILPKKKLAIHAHPTALIIGKPIETKGLSPDDRDRLTARAHAEVEALLARGNALVDSMR